MGEEQAPNNPDEGLGTPPGAPEAPGSAGEGGGEGAGEGKGRPYTPEEHAQVTRAQQAAAEAARRAEEATRLARDHEIAAARAQAELEALRTSATPPKEDEVSSQLDPVVRNTKAYKDQMQKWEALAKENAELQAQIADVRLRTERDKYPLYSDPEVQQRVFNDIRRLGKGASDPNLVTMVYRNHAFARAEARAADLERQLAEARAANAKAAQLGQTDLAPPAHASGGAAPTDYSALPTADKAAEIDAEYRRRGLR
jgi:hypothetical protein